MSARASPDASAEGPEEHLHGQGGLHADVAHAAGAVPELPHLLVGTAEELHERGAGGREPLGHLRGHGRVVVGAFALEGAYPRTDAPGGDHEHGQQHQGQQRDLPRQAGHHGHGQHEGDGVGDHPGQRRGERALGADDVVVEPADQRTRAGAGEERDRHPLHVREHAAAQVEDEVLAEASGLHPLPQTHHGLDERDDRDEHAQADDRAVSPFSTMASTASPASTGVATPSTAAAVASTRKLTMVRACGRANSPTRRIVCRSTRRRWPSSCIALCNAIHALKSLMPWTVRPQVGLRSNAFAQPLRRARSAPWR